MLFASIRTQSSEISRVPAVGHLLRHPEDKPSTGLILRKGKDGIVALYTHLENLPHQFKVALPMIKKEIEAELGKPGEHAEH